jgi:hypothetical protein
MITAKTLKMFWERVVTSDDPNICWKWTGAKKPKGYGSLCVREAGVFSTHAAHRLSYLIHTGQPPEKLHVLHRCDNPECTNPKHLFLGTNLDNNRDMNSKGRAVYVRGEASGKTTLTESQAQYILDNKGKMLSTSLAKQFNITRWTVQNIWAGRAWKHLKDKNQK